MTPFAPLAGVYAAALTPLKPDDGSLDLDGLAALLDFLARRGCHGALLLGTTGEGPSFAPAERQALFAAAAGARPAGFRLLAGTGTPSLAETVDLTRIAFKHGFDGVVVLPPYYYRKASEDGLFAWFSQVIQQAVPEGGAFLGYHIPGVSGVPLSLDLLARLAEAFPDCFAGLKDSSADLETARQIGARFKGDLLVLNGTDRLFSLALENGASGCITALANLASPALRRVWDAFQRGERDADSQACLDRARAFTERFPTAPPALKSLLAARHGFPRWAVRPPLLPLTSEQEAQALAGAEVALEGIG